LSYVSHFTTESYPAAPRMAAWREMLGQFSLHVKDRGGSSLYGTVSSARSPQGVLFGRVASGPQDWLYRGERNDALNLVLQMEGEAVLLTEARKVPLAPGDMIYGAPGAVASLSMPESFRQLLISVPAALFRSRLVRPLPMQVGHICGGSGIGHVFSSLLLSVAVNLESLSAEELGPVEIALPELLATSLAEAKADTLMQAATSAQTATLHRISQLIELRLGDPALTPADIAQQAGVSVRYLQKLFEAVGDSFSRYLRLRRLERCRADLVNPHYTHLSITDICFRWGFNEAAHFSRAFREQYGMSPRTYRSDVGDPVSRSMLLHMGRGWPDISHETYKKLTRNEGGLDVPERPAAAPLAGIDAGARAAGLRHHYLPATDKTVHWGYFSRMLPPVLEIASGDIVTVETLSHHCGDDYERMVRGDSGAESIYRWTAGEKTVARRGAGPVGANVYGRGAGEGFGVHICTGPIAVAGAEPGDVIEVRILDVRRRANTRFGNRTFGSNAAAWWGFHYKDLLTEPRPREIITIYEIDGAEGREYARALYSYRWTPQTDPDGIVHPTIDYPGVCVDHATIEKNHDVLKNVRIPVRPHFGVIALAPREAGLVDSIPPSYFGGNIDDKRAGRGATLYLPVSVAGGLLSIGDPHAAQGDGEVCGTAIECSLTGTFQIVLHKKRDHAGKPFADLNYPLLETPHEWVLHGFTCSNYLAELGQTAQSEIYKRSSLDPAMRDAFRKMRRFLMTAKGLTEDEAISLMSVAVDFGITQVVDGNWCVHGILRKSLFCGSGGAEG